MSTDQYLGGAKYTETGEAYVTKSAVDTAAIGSVTETAPATDTASSGLNGRLQRIAQRITSLIALIPTDWLTGAGYSSSATKTRPSDTNAYAALDVIAESTSAGTVWTFANLGPATGQILITKAMLEVDLAAVITGMDYRLHLYSAAPTAINDNAAYDLPSGDRAKYLGSIDFSTPVDLGSTLISLNTAIRVSLTTVTSSVYGILQAITGYTPSSADVIKITLNAVRV